MAQELGKFEGGLSLGSLTSINKDVAQELGKLKGRGLGLQGLTSIQGGAAKELFNTNVWVKKDLLLPDLPSDFADIDQMTLDELGKLVLIHISYQPLPSFRQPKDKQLKLSGLYLLDKDKAELLASYPIEELWLDGLDSIDKDTARELAKFKGEYINLSGLRSLEPEVARELVNTDSKKEMALSSLFSINVELARELGNFKGQMLNLNGLDSIDKNIVKELSSLKSGLNMQGLSSIDKETAHEMGKMQARFLNLKNSISFTRDIAQELANFKGEYIRLDRVPYIDRDTALILLKFEADRVYIPNAEIPYSAAKLLNGQGKKFINKNIKKY